MPMGMHHNSQAWIRQHRLAVLGVPLFLQEKKSGGKLFGLFDGLICFEKYNADFYIPGEPFD